MGLAFLASISARSEGPQNSAAEGNRFLFVVETSSASSRLEHGGRQTVVDLIYTGIYGQMREGDTFGIWNFNEQVFAGTYPMQAWTRDDMEAATRAGQFLKSQKYAKKARLDLVAKQVGGLLRGVKDVNVFIISDPGIRLSSDAFGVQWARDYAEAARIARGVRQPVITTVVARHGSISNMLVTVGGEPFRLPAIAIPPHAPAAAVAVARAPQPTAPRAPIIIRRESAGQVLSSSAQVSYVKSTQTNSAASLANTNVAASTAAPVPVPQSSFTEAAAANTPKSTPAAPTSLPTQPQPHATESSSSVASATPKDQQTTSVAPPPPAATTASIEPKTKVRPAASPTIAALEPLKVIARERPMAAQTNAHAAGRAPAVATVSPTLTDRLFSPAAMVVIGSLLFLLAATLTLLLVQRLRRVPEPSFITQSLERH